MPLIVALEGAIAVPRERVSIIMLPSVHRKGTDMAAPPLPSGKGRSLPAIETPVEAGSPPKLAAVRPARSRGNSFSATIELESHFAATQSESAVALDAGATGNLVCCKWFGNRTFFLGEKGFANSFLSVCCAIQVRGWGDW